MTKELYENLVTLATTDFRSRLKLKSVEVVQQSKSVTDRQNNAVKTPPLKAPLHNFIN